MFLSVEVSIEYTYPKVGSEKYSSTVLIFSVFFMFSFVLEGRRCTEGDEVFRALDAQALPQNAL